jgi:hypothetical protein
MAFGGFISCSDVKDLNITTKECAAFTNRKV